MAGHIEKNPNMQQPELKNFKGKEKDQIINAAFEVLKKDPSFISYFNGIRRLTAQNSIISSNLNTLIQKLSFILIYWHW